MELKEMISISGKPGLYKVVARSVKNFIVESLDDQKTRFSVTASQQVALLDEITVYTHAADGMPLKDIFENMKAAGAKGPVPSAKDNPVAIRDFFKTVAPDYDQDRVYISDMKKILKWYDIVSNLKQEETEATETTEEAKSAEN